MRGHEPLIAMRKRGATPQSVWFDLDGGDAWKTWPAAMATRWRNHPEAVGSAEIMVEAGDAIPRLDLRFVVGMQVRVMGADLKRVRQLARACADAGAKRVLGVGYEPDHKGNPHAALLLDSAGQLGDTF